MHGSNEIEQAMRFVEIETGREIETEAIQIVMADGSTFQILKDSFEGNAAYLRIEPEPGRVLSFSIEPRATNLVALRVIEKKRATNDGAPGDKSS